MQYINLFTGQVDKRNWIFVPIGSIEGHGASLPVGTDLYVAKAFANLFSDGIGGIVFPDVFTGVLPNTNQFELSVSFSHQTLISILCDLCSELHAKGFVRIILVNIHKGNDASIKVAVEKLFLEKNIQVIYINPYSFINGDTQIFTDYDNSFKETSLFLAANKLLNLKIKMVRHSDEKCDRKEEMDTLRNYGYIGFHYDSESQHIAARASASLEKGMEFMRLTTMKVMELISQFENMKSEMTDHE